MVKHYGAVTTPHFFVVDENGVLRYKGALDDITFRQKIATESYLLDSIANLLNGKEPHPTETPGYGCAIFKKYPQET
jgi:hypothetical protein